MIWCVFFVGLLMFDVGFVFGCWFCGRKREDVKASKVIAKDREKKPYKPTNKEKLLLEDFKMLNNFNGYNDIEE